MLIGEDTDAHRYKLDRDLTNLYVGKIYTGDVEIDQIIDRYAAKSMGIALA